ncbi:hypothetical protein KI387_010299, partial [Taxus chinensis]
PIQVHNNVEERAYDNDDSGTHNEEEDTYMGDTTSQLNEDGVNEFLQDFYTYAEEVDDSPLTQLARTPLYPNANLSVLATLMLFLNLKVMHGMTNTCFTDILRIVEVIKQIHALESTLLESTGLAAPEQEENGMPPDVPNGEATVTPTTATISTVNTKGKKEVHHFRKEASDEDLKYALMHGSQGLRQHMIDRGEKLVIEHESEDVQQSNSLKGATDSEHEDATEGCDDFVAGQNESIDLLGTHLENNPEIQQTRVQDDYHVAPSIIVPRQKRTKKNRHFSYPAK